MPIYGFLVLLRSLESSNWYQLLFLATQIHQHTTWNLNLFPTKCKVQSETPSGCSKSCRKEVLAILKTCSWPPKTGTHVFHGKSKTTSQNLVACLLSVKTRNMLLQNSCAVKAHNSFKALRIQNAKLNSTVQAPSNMLSTPIQIQKEKEKIHGKKKICCWSNCVIIISCFTSKSHKM